jgi:hypothetical protein
LGFLIHRFKYYCKNKKCGYKKRAAKSGPFY